MKKVLSVLGLGLLLGLLIMPQAARADIQNGGFEDGVLTPWISTGQTNITNAGTDPRTNNALSMVGIGTHSARVGDENAYGYVGSATSSVTQTFTLGSGFTTLYFAWAAVGLVPTNTYHSVDETPWFQVSVYDNTTSTMLKQEQFYTGNFTDGINPGWSAGATHTGALGQDDGGVWYYRPWTQYALDVSSHTGDSITVTLDTRDCALSGHASYAYLDGFGSVPTGVPEPATLILLGCALAGLYGIRRKMS